MSAERGKGKKMKRIISILIIAAMSFALVGCGGAKPEILGVYETRIDLTDIIAEEFDRETGVGDILSIADYMDKCEIVVIHSFNEDGTYSQNVDESSVETSVENIKQAAVLFMNDLAVYIFVEQFKAIGFEVNSKEDVEALLGMSIEDAFYSSTGTDLETMVIQLVDESFDIETMASENLSSGKYKAEGGKLYMSASLDTDYNEEFYETYTIEGDVVTVDSGNLAADQEILSYPFTMVKVG